MRRLMFIVITMLAMLAADQTATRANPTEAQFAAFLKIAQAEKDPERKSDAVQNVADLHARFGNIEKALEVIALAGQPASQLKTTQESLRSQAVEALRRAGDHKRALEATAGLHPMSVASAHLASARALLVAGRKSEAAELLKGISYERGGRLVIGSGSKAVIVTDTNQAPYLVMSQAKAGLAKEATKVFALLEADVRKEEILSAGEWAVVLAAMGQAGRAKAVLAKERKAAERMPSGSEKMQKLVSVAAYQYDAGLDNDARQTLDQAIKAAAAFPKSKFVDAVALTSELLRVGRVEEGIDRMVKLEKDNAPTFVTAAFDPLVWTGKVPAARKLLAAAAKLPAPSGDGVLWPVWLAGAAGQIAALEGKGKEAKSKFGQVLEMARKGGEFEQKMMSDLVLQMEAVASRVDLKAETAAAWARLTGIITEPPAGALMSPTHRLSLLVSELVANDSRRELALLSPR